MSLTGERKPRGFSKLSSDALRANDNGAVFLTGKRKIHPGLLFGIVCAAQMMSSIDLTIVSTALPTLKHALHAPISWTGWTITVYSLGQIVALPVAGKISDQFGRKKVFLWSLVLFTLSSLFCGLSDNIYLLVGFRAIQALGGGAFTPTAMGLVTDIFGKNRDRAAGMFLSIVPIGSMIGPVIGGSIIAAWSWRGVFFVNLPIGAVVFLLAVMYVPRTRPKEVSGADYLGIGLLAGCMLPLMYAITTLGDKNASMASATFLIPFLASIGIGYLFVRHANRTTTPIIAMHLVRIRSFAAMNVVSFIYGGCFLGFAALVPLYAEDRYHFSPIEAGSFLTGRALATVVTATATSWMLRRVGYRLPMLTGFGFTVIAMLLLGIAPHGLGTYAWLVVAATLMGIGNGIAAPATNNVLFSLVPKETASVAGIRGMFRQIGGIVSISIVTAETNRSANGGIVLAHAFIEYAIAVFVIAIPMVLLVPDQKGTW